jgi:hypothetical protein
MKPILIFTFLLLFFIIRSKAEKITVGAEGDFETITAAVNILEPGDTIVVLSQTFAGGQWFLDAINGSSENPIVIMAETKHQSIFQGGSQALHLRNCNYIEIDGFVFENQTSNGVNIDDGADYNSPSKNITVRNCIFRNLAQTGNHDFLKMSGVDEFLVEKCTFTAGTGGSGIDLVGCHKGVIQDCEFNDAGSSGIQCKGGSQHITIQRNILRNMSNRAINLGGSTGLDYFRPPLTNPVADAFEAADISVFSNIFIGSMSPIAYVGCIRVKVINNTFYKPDKWVIRILQETTDEGFLPCSNNEFSNNIVYLEKDITEVNIGSNTSPETFTFTNNLWFNESSDSWKPNLPVTDRNQVIGNPLFSNLSDENFTLMPGSPAISAGLYFIIPDSDFSKKLFANPPSIGAFEGNSGTVGVGSYMSPSKKTRIYPNPSDGNFYVDIGVGDETYNYMVSDINGKVVLSANHIRERNSCIKIQEPAGIYILKIESKTGLEIFQLVKN